MISSFERLNGILLEIGDRIEVNGVTYELDILQDGGGFWAIWYDVNDDKAPRVWATPNYDGRGVPIDIVDFDGDLVFADAHKPLVSSYREYKSIVKTLIKRSFYDAIKKREAKKRG